MNGETTKSPQQARSRLDVKAYEFLSIIRDELHQKTDSDGPKGTTVHSKQHQINPDAHAINSNDEKSDHNKPNSEVMGAVANSIFNHEPSFTLSDLFKKEQKMGRTSGVGNIRPRHKPSQVTFSMVKIRQYETSEDASTCPNKEKGVRESLMTVNEFESCRTQSRIGKIKKLGKSSQMKVGIRGTRRNARTFRKNTFRGKTKQPIPVNYILNRVHSFLAEGNNEHERKDSTSAG